MPKFNPGAVSPFSDASEVVINKDDDSKKLRFDLSALTPGVTVTLTLTDAGLPAVNLGSPGPIGNVTPDTITGTVITATTQLVGAKFSESTTAGIGATLAAGSNTAAATRYALDITQTLNNASALGGLRYTVTDTSSSASFLPLEIKGGVNGTTVLTSLDKGGSLTIGGGTLFGGAGIGAWSVGGDGSGFGIKATNAVSLGLVGGNSGTVKSLAGVALGWVASTTAVYGQALETAFSRLAPGVIGIGTGAAGSTAGSLTASTLTATANLTVGGGAFLISASAALTNGAGVGAGTLTTAPSAGNPSKWLAVNDAGTTRYIPAW